MAAYTVRVTVNSGGLIELDNAGGTLGESELNPLPLNAGDTVTFDGFSIATNRSATISGLSIFTNNGNVSITSNASSVTRTVASGGATSNTVIGTSDLFETDSFYFERQAVTGTLTPASFATSESQGGVTVTANVSATGTYYWDLERNPGEPSGSNSFGFSSPTSGTLSLTANTNQNFSTGAPNQNAGSTSNIGYQGVGFTIDLFTGPSRSGTLLDTSNWNIYETVTGLSVGSSSISLNAGDSTFSQNVTTNWRGSDSVSIRIRNTTLSTTVDSFSTSNGSTTLGRTGITSPPAGSSYNYRVEAFNGNSWLTNGPTFSVTRASYSPPDTDVTVTSSREYSPGVTSYTMSFSNGTNGDQYQLRQYDAGAANGSVVGTATANSSGTFSITVGSTYLANSGSSDTKWFSLYARRPTANGGDNSYDYCSGTTLVNSLNLTRRPYTPTINNVTDDDAASASVGIIINVSDSTSNSPGTVDRLYLYQYKNGALNASVNRTWGGNGNYADNFQQPRNTGGDNYYYRAFVQKSGTGTTPQAERSGTSFSDYFPSNGGNYQAGYISPDTSITTSRIPSGNLAADYSGTVTVFVSNGGTNDTYRIYRTSPSLLLIGDTGPLVTTTGTIDLSEATSGHLPPPGQTYEYAISAKRAASLGGTDVYVNTGTTFSITKNGPSGTVGFAGATSATEGTGLEFVFTNNVDGTYYYDIDRLSGSVGGGEITNPGPSSFSVSSGSARLTLNFVNDSTTEIGFQGEDFTMKYGTTSGASDLDTLNFTLYDDDSGISYTSSTVNVNGAATSHQISVVRATGDSSTSVSAYVAVSPGFTPLSTNLSSGSGNDFILGTGTTVITVNDVPGAGSSETYYVRINNGATFISGPTYTVNQSAVPTAPTSITFEADQNVANTSITQAVTISGGSGGTIQYSEDNSTWFNYSGPTDFTFTRNSPKTIYARRNDGGALSSVSQSSKTYGYFTGDPSATASAKEASISANDLTGVGIAVEGGSANTRYRVVNTSVSPTFGLGNTGDGNGTITADGNTQDLPGKGQTDTYKVQYKVIPTKGGDDTWRDVSPISNTTISRTTDIPNSFTLDTRTNQATNTEVVDNVQITGLTQESIVRRTAGTGTFAVSSTSTTPSAGSFSTADKTITNSQYIHVKDTTSTSSGTQKSTTISVGTQTLTTTNNFSPAPETSTFSYTTAVAGDVTVTMVYDPESGSFLPAPSLSPTVSGQDGLSQNTAREITAGTDVVFQNTSDPGAGSITVSGLNQFTNNSSFTVAQGSSVTRTWASGVLGNVVDQLSLSAGTAGDLIYFREPAVDPDLTVTPVTPANIDWDKTTSFNVTVNDVTSGETYKITENNFTTSLGSATASGTSVTIPMTLGNSTTGYGQLGLGDTKTYEIHASRPANLGGTGSFVQTDDTFTVTRSSQVVVAPTNITFSPASTVSKSTNVIVDVEGDETEGRTLQIRLGSGSWLNAPQTYNLTRGEIYSFSARTVGFQGASVSGLRVESYQVPYLSPDTSVSVIVATTIAANAGNQTVRVQDGSSLDQYSVTNSDGSVTYDSVPSLGNGNMTLTAASPDELPASGSNQSYRIRVYRPIDNGGAGPGSVVNTNQSFTISRSDPTQPTVTIDADPGTRSKSVSLGVDASGGTGSTFQVSEDNSNFVASGTAFEFTRGVNKTVYGRSLTDSNPSTSGTASRELAYIAPNTAITLALSTSSITAGATASITANFSGGTSGDIVELRTNDTNTPLASGASVGSATFNGSGTAAITISSGEQPDALNSTAQYRAFVKTPDNLGGDDNFDGSVTASITRGTITQPNAPSIPNDTTTRSKSVSLTVTVDGGSGGVLELSENQTVWFTTDTQAFEFTRGTEKTIYARRRDGAVVSTTSQASRDLDYIAPNTNIGLALSTSSITAGATANITASFTGGTEGDLVQLRTNDTNTPLASGQSVGFDTFDSSGNASITISSGEQPDVQNTTAQYRAFVETPDTLGGDDLFDATSVTASITRGSISQPTSIQFPADPGTLDDQVSLTVTIGGGSGGDLEISENNSTWFTQESKAFTFTRNTPKTIYARRIDGAVTSAVSNSSFTLPYLTADSTIGITPSATSITAGYSGTITVAITGATPQDVYRLITTDTDTPQASGYVIEDFTGTTASSFTIPNNALPDVQNTDAGYRVEVLRPVSAGGDGSTQVSAGTFTISRGGISAPDSIQFPADPGTLSKSVSLTVTIGGGSGGDLEISEDNSTWFTQASKAFEFTRNVEKTIYARRIDGAVTSAVSNSSFELTYLEPDTTIGITPSTTSITAGYGGTVTVAITGATPQDIYRIVTTDTNTPQVSGYVVDQFTGTTASSLTIANNELPDGLNTSAGYRVEALRPQNAGGEFVPFSAGTFTISRGGISAPDSIQFPADPGTASKSVSLTVTIGGGSGGDLQISEDNTNWVTATSLAFEFTRNTPKTIYARRNDAGTISGVTTSSFTLPYLAGDPTVTLNVSESTLAFSNQDNVTAGITNGGATSLYRLVNNATPSTVYDTVTGNSTLTLQYPAELPTGGNSIQYRLQYARTEASGGDPDNWQTATPATFTVDREAADRDPENFTALAGNVADADLSTQHYATFSGTTAGTTSPGTGFDVGTTIDNGTDISVSNGEYSLNAGGNWLSGDATINQTQVVYFRGQSSGTNGTQTTHSLTIGNTTRSFTTTTFGDSFPDNYTNLGGNNLDAALNTRFYATFSTAQPGTTADGTGFNVGTTISNNTQVSVVNGQYKIGAGGTYTSTAGTIDQNQTIYFRSDLTPSASGQQIICSLTIGSTTQSFQLKTGVASGTAKNAGLAKGNDTYGIALYGPDGSTEVWGVNVRQTNILVNDTFTLGTNSSSSFACLDADDDTKVIVSVGAPFPTTGPAAQAAQQNISTSTSATGFTVSNTSSTQTVTLRVIAARIS